MIHINPLAKFSIIDTKRVEKAEAEISRSLTDIKIQRIQHRSNFELQMNGINIGQTSMLFNRFGSTTKIKAELDEESVLFIIGGSTPATFLWGKEPVVVSPHTAAMITSGKQMDIQRFENSEVLVLRTFKSDLLHHFERVTARHHRGTFIFDQKISLTKGSGAMLKRMINYLVYELEHNDLVMKTPGLLKNYDDMLLSALISLPNNQRGKFYKNHHCQTAPGLVKRSEEYMRAHLNETISIIDLLRVCDCSRSALFAVFRTARGYTPMEFLTEQRLQNARKKLLKPHPEASISSIALNCGFTNLGRFAQVYKKRFGELPSSTLKKRK
jgi:AraC-like DNA-binding protein